VASETSFELNASSPLDLGRRRMEVEALEGGLRPLGERRSLGAQVRALQGRERLVLEEVDMVGAWLASIFEVLLKEGA
jgi:hypothetical protein